MKSPAHKWIRLLTVSALLVLTTGIAAAPIRNFVLPLAARQLQLWGFVPAASVPSVRASSTVSKLDGDIGLSVMAEPASYSTVSAGSATGDRKKDDNDSNDASNRGLGNSRNAWSGRLNVRRPGTTARSDRGRQVGGSDSPIRNEVGQPGNRDGHNGLFAEHTAGLPELTGRKTTTGGTESPKGGHGGGNSPPNVAANPEPSTLLLLGTGLAVGFGAIRRRLRSR